MILKQQHSAEGILENAAHLGLPVPEQLKAVLEQLHDRAGKNEEAETVIGEEVGK